MIKREILEKRIEKLYPGKAQETKEYRKRLLYRTEDYFSIAENKLNNKRIKADKKQKQLLIERLSNLYIKYDKMYANNKKGSLIRGLYEENKQKCFDELFECELKEINRYKEKYICKNIKEFTEELNDKVQPVMENEANSSIKSYHSHPKENLVFLKTKADKKTENRFFGLELESYGNKENAIEMQKYDSLFYIEEDGSLPDEGFEIITNPMTRKYFKHIKNDFKKILEYLTSHNQKVNADCGMHIHVSKNAFKNEEAILRAIMIVGMSKNQMQRFARRKEQRGYYHYIAKYNPRFLWFETEQDYNCLWNDRYVSVNATNDDTVEFRIFKGTLDIVAIDAALTLVNNIIDLANSSKKVLTLAEVLSGKEIETYLNKYGIKIDKTKQIDLERKHIKNEKETIGKLSESLKKATRKKWRITVDKTNKTIALAEKTSSFSLKICGNKIIIPPELDDFDSEYKLEDILNVSTLITEIKTIVADLFRQSKKAKKSKVLIPIRAK